MGYTVQTFIEIGNLSLSGKNVLDVGSQDLTIFSDSELALINEFILNNNIVGKKIELDQFPAVIEAKKVYTQAGFDYTCIDVDERPDTIRVDLAKFEIPREFKNTFDLVVNVGTTEHLASPAAAFALIHEMSKEGGILFNHVPLFGFGNHGLINPTAKFWHAMVWMNQYIVKYIEVIQYDESLVDEGNFYHDYLSYMKGLKSCKNISYMIKAVFEKRNSLPFVIPYDAVFPSTDGGESLASLLYGSYYPFLQTGAYLPQEVVCSINNFLELNQKTYRVKSLDEIGKYNTNGSQAAIASLSGHLNLSK